MYLCVNYRERVSNGEQKTIHKHTQVSSEARLHFNLPGGHKVVVVDNFEEGLDAVSAGTLLFAHSLSDGSRVSVNTSHQSMAIALGIGALVLILQDNRLAARIFALQQQHHLAGFHDFTHFGSRRLGSKRRKPTGEKEVWPRSAAWKTRKGKSREREKRVPRDPLVHTQMTSNICFDSANCR